MNSVTVEIPVTDLDDVRTTLGAVSQYLQAEDIAQSQRRLRAQTEYSALTNEVVRIVARVENILKDHLLDMHDVEEEVEVEVDPYLNNDETALD